MQPPKPNLMPVNAENIPEQLKRIDRWVVWNWKWNGKKYDKPPLQISGKAAKSNDPQTWTSFDSAFKAHESGRFDGVGFMLGPVDGVVYSGLDLDDCIDPSTGQPSVEACFLIASIRSYTELSPSGKGTKTFTTGRLGDGRKVDHELGVEMFDSGRYFTVTGHHLPGSPREIDEVGDKLAELQQMVFGHQSFSTDVGQLSDHELAIDALKGLSPARALNYHDWIRVGMALHAVDPSPYMCAEWVKFSKQCPEKFNDGECERKWESFQR